MAFFLNNEQHAEAMKVLGDPRDGVELKTISGEGLRALGVRFALADCKREMRELLDAMPGRKDVR